MSQHGHRAPKSIVLPTLSLFLFASRDPSRIFPAPFTSILLQLQIHWFSLGTHHWRDDLFPFLQMQKLRFRNMKSLVWELTHQDPKWLPRAYI